MSDSNTHYGYSIHYEAFGLPLTNTISIQLSVGEYLSSES